MPHIGLVSFEVETFPAGSADDFADIEIVLKLLLDTSDVGLAVSGGLQLVCDIGVGPRQGGGRLIKCGALRFPFLQVRRYLCVAAEVVDVLQLILRRLHGLA